MASRLIPSHFEPWFSIFDTDRIVCGAGSMKRSSVVCLSHRSTAAPVAGRFAAECHAGRVPAAGAQQHGAQQQMRAVPRSHSFSVLMPLSVGISRSRNLQCPIKAQNVDYGRSQFWKRKFSCTTFKILYRKKTVLCILSKSVQLKLNK